MFALTASTHLGRRGKLELNRGTIETPFFMPVGTAGAMKGLTHKDIVDLGAQILISNTYHLHLQPGENIVEDAGGLHEFIGWEKPILTDSGGYQVFSLRTMNKIDDSGVHFRSHINGDPLYIGPEESIRIQHALGSDIIMAFDECPPSTASRSEIEKAVDRTLKWAQSCKRLNEELKTRNHRSASSSRPRGKPDSEQPLLFGIVQGGLERDLREKCAQELVAMGFDGYAIGGLAVGETPEEMYDVLDVVCPQLPEDKLRYLMGVGVIHQLQKCVAKGIDMFDCVLPMRIARHGTILLSDGTDIRISNAEFRNDHSVIDPDSPADLGRSHKKSYLHHLFSARERLAETIASQQNLGVTLRAMQQLREEIQNS